MTRAERVMAALAAADLAEERGDLRNAAELLAQVEQDLHGGGANTLPAFQPDERPSQKPNGRYSVARPTVSRYSFAAKGR